MENTINPSSDINSWFVKQHESGIYSLCFNTHEKWIPYHRYNNTEYLFGDDVLSDSKDIKPMIIPEFLPKEISYIPTVIQDKDQISFFFIPLREMLHPKNSTIILNSKK